jgi:hypothetical protein
LLLLEELLLKRYNRTVIKSSILKMLLPFEMNQLIIPVRFRVSLQSTTFENLRNISQYTIQIRVSQVNKILYQEREQTIQLLVLTIIILT